MMPNSCRFSHLALRYALAGRGAGPLGAALALVDGARS